MDFNNWEYQEEPFNVQEFIQQEIESEYSFNIDYNSESDSSEDDMDDIEQNIGQNGLTNNTQGVTTRRQAALILRQFNQAGLKSIPNPEEQIIQSRGRRQMPRTPVRRSPRKRPSVEVDQHHEDRDTQPQQSPFTKCLQHLMSPPLKRPQISTQASANRSSSVAKQLKTLFEGVRDRKYYYYSPNTRVLRSSDVSVQTLDDSGIEVSPYICPTISTRSSVASDSSSICLGQSSSSSLKDDSSSEISAVSQTSSGPTPSTRRINRVRRRFRF